MRIESALQRASCERKRLYSELKKYPATGLERKINAQLLLLNRKRSIPDALYMRLRSSCGRTPALYGLPKVYKPGVPLRPIASFETLSTYQAMILSPLVGRSQSNVRNSRDFATFIREQTLSDDEVLVSFNVVSLFTNVPMTLAIVTWHEKGYRWMRSWRTE